MEVGYVHYIFASLFLSLKESTWETWKIFFLFYFLIYFKSSFHSRENQILGIQILWRHQMPKHETRNTFY